MAQNTARFTNLALDFISEAGEAMKAGSYGVAMGWLQMALDSLATSARRGWQLEQVSVMAASVKASMAKAAALA